MTCGIEKYPDKLFVRPDKQNCPLYTGVLLAGFHCNRADSNTALRRVLVIYNNDNNGHIIKPLLNKLEH